MHAHIVPAIISRHSEQKKTMMNIAHPGKLDMQLLLEFRHTLFDDEQQPDEQSAFSLQVYAMTDL